MNRAVPLMVMLGLTATAGAQDDAASGDTAVQLSYQTGEILLPNKVAKLALSDRYRYLDPKETEKLLVAWGNPPGSETLGAIVPGSTDPLEADGWAVIVTYIDDGHVDDSDAQTIDYDELLASMKEGTAADNEERLKAGYEPVELVGWADRPRYDATTHRLYWGKTLHFGTASAQTLNYDVRVLGREGVLSLNAVASMDQLAQVGSDMEQLIPVAQFNAGHRYEEFDASTDQVAAYGLGALVAGGVAAKLGLFGKLAAALLAFKKVLIPALIAAGAFAMRLFRRKSAAVPLT